MSQAPLQPNTEARIAPSKMAHFVIRTSRYPELVDWYRTLFCAELVFANEEVTFITFDDEHHRMAIANVPGLQAKVQGTVGVDHIAFSYRSIAELLGTYERLKGHGIRPFWCINHGATTSIYYRDPEGNDIELQVDNFPDPADAAAVFQSREFAQNPLGIEFDPDALVALWRSGASDAELCRQGSARLDASGMSANPGGDVP